MSKNQYYSFNISYNLNDKSNTVLTIFDLLNRN